MAEPPLYREYAELYDRIYSAKDYAAEARRLTRLARELNPSARTLLDVACGTGRHLEQFRRSFDVEGVDASPRMLSLARRRLGRSVRLTRADMRSFDLGREFDVLTCLFSAIGYVRTDADRRRTFRQFYRHIAPGGVALVEGWILPSRFRGASVHLQTYDGPDLKIARASSSSRTGSTSRIEMRYLVAQVGRPVRHWREVHLNDLVEPREMLAAMRAAGFRARMVRSPSYRDRGLFVGVRPRRPGPRRPTRDRARRARSS